MRFLVLARNRKEGASMTADDLKNGDDSGTHQLNLNDEAIPLKKT